MPREPHRRSHSFINQAWRGRKKRGIGRPRHADCFPPNHRPRLLYSQQIRIPRALLTGARPRLPPRPDPSRFSLCRRPLITGRVLLSFSPACSGGLIGRLTRSPDAWFFPPLGCCLFWCKIIPVVRGFNYVADPGRELRDQAATILGG
ncbi:hypothetical protein NDU88_010389 [Pleurodeles waltl]|uniref:Uncharacterized protein n=1 Tax=Pleurodeles waltl TaxID=8319 RepID=A0AAV7RZI3_PLEWA|nr:hypothetical protein NDU88_010389 [Pleurodeles waltl]